MPVAVQTMHNALVGAGRLKKGETVLIQGASSGVGLLGMQIAKIMGLSEANVRVILFRTLRKLRQMMGARPGAVS